MTKTKSLEVLAPDSPRWEAFIEQLNGRLSEQGCAGGTNKDNAIAVMRDMGGVDIGGSLAYCEDHGGYCDCEIILNVCTGEEECLNDCEMTDEEMRVTDKITRVLTVRNEIRNAIEDALGCKDMELGCQMTEPYGELFF